MARKPALGRGLSSLIREHGKADQPAPGDQLLNLPVEHLQPGEYQPRSHMDAERLEELAASIRAQGMIQPIIVRAVGAGRYEIVAGERRWRAAQLAELREVPVVVRKIDDSVALAMALIENIQREDLNPLEEALALQRLAEEFGLTHKEVAEAVGRSRATVSNLLRLLELPGAIRSMLEARELEMGHARALLTLPETQAIALAREAVAGGWSVRETERRVRQLQNGERRPKRKPAEDPDVQALERELSDSLGTRVQIRAGRGGRGKLVISYHAHEQLDGILERLRQD